MIRYNEQKRIDITDTMLDTAGFTADEKTKVIGVVVSRNVDSDNNCNFNMHIGNRGDWNVSASATLPEHTVDEVFNKLLEITLQSIRGTLGTVVPEPAGNSEE